MVANLLPENNYYYIYLSNYKLTEYQKEFLDLGPNCHLYNEYNQLFKKQKLKYLKILKNFKNKTRLKLIQESKIYLKLK